MHVIDAENAKTFLIETHQEISRTEPDMHDDDRFDMAFGILMSLYPEVTEDARRLDAIRFSLISEQGLPSSTAP